MNRSATGDFGRSFHLAWAGGLWTTEGGPEAAWAKGNYGPKGHTKGAQNGRPPAGLPSAGGQPKSIWGAGTEVRPFLFPAFC